MINFLVEISKKFEIIIYPTPSNKYTKNYNIYELDIRKPNYNTYWTDCGGTYDNFEGEDIEIYYTKFLQKLTESEVLNTPFSMFIDDGKVFMNLPMHPWLYPNFTAESRTVIPFLSSALNPDNPSNNILNNTPSLTKLEIPSVSIKLSDSFNGISLNQGFSISLSNNDGYFDDENEWNLFNTPLNLKKSIADVSEYKDFKDIRSGFVESTITSLDKFQISVSDKIRSMNEPVCNVLSNSLYPDIKIDNNVIGKNIPVVYGDRKVNLLKLNDRQYLAAEKITSVHSIFDKDNTIVNGYSFDARNGIITFEDSSIDAKSAIITGYTNNTIGEIIVDIIARKTKIPYGITNWNEGEITKYINISPRISIELNSGDVKKAITEILKSDMAYFIQQLDGKFTIRKYGEIYNTHTIQNWTLTKKPEKDYGKAQENYFSSCIINYDFIDKDTFKSYLYNDRENEAEDLYRKKLVLTFDTYLSNQTDAIDLAILLGKRYINLKQIIKLSVGIDTSNMNLLDTVIIDMKVNDRVLSNSTNYIITEINPSQDTLTLEEI